MARCSSSSSSSRSSSSGGKGGKKDRMYKKRKYVKRNNPIESPKDTAAAIEPRKKEKKVGQKSVAVVPHTRLRRVACSSQISKSALDGLSACLEILLRDVLRDAASAASGKRITAKLVCETLSAKRDKYISFWTPGQVNGFAAARVAPKARRQRNPKNKKPLKGGALLLPANADESTTSRADAASALESKSTYVVDAFDFDAL